MGKLLKNAKSPRMKKLALRMKERAVKKVKASRAQKTRRERIKERARKKVKASRAQKTRRGKAAKTTMKSNRLRGRKERAHKDNHNKYRKNKSRKQTLTSKSMSLNAKKRLIKTLPRSQRDKAVKAAMKGMSSEAKIKAMSKP